MTNEFIEEIINAAHMRLLSPDFEVVKNGFDILDTISIRVDPEKKEQIKKETKKINDGYNETFSKITNEPDHIKRNKMRLMLEFDRLKHMIEFYSNLNKEL